MPAVDSPEPDGLDYSDLATVLRVLFASRLAVGINIAIYDPDLDPDGTLDAELTDTIVGGLSSASA